MEKLEMIASTDEVWSAAALEMTVNDTGAREQIQAGGQRIVACVVAGRLSVDDLRGCARWTARLAHEAALAAGQESERNDEEQQLEIAARHILHGSVSAALNKVRTESRLTTQRVGRAARSNFA